MNRWMESATLAVERVYDDFLTQVVEEHVSKEREGALSESMLQRIDKGTHIDPRVIRLMAVSGKGGWHPDPERRKRYAKNANVTLLDHLLSVVRGAMMLGALDWLASNPEMDLAILTRRLRAIAVIAFLHDLDKLRGLERDTDLPLDEVDDALRRYGLSQFLADVGLKLAADQVRYLIERVEASQAFRHPPTQPPPREVENLTDYVGLADKLDGIWLSSDPETGGLAGVLARLKNDQTLHHDPLRAWRPLELFDPHHPFLLDELQRWLAHFSLRRAGTPPLIEAHQDGRLFALLPAEPYDDILERALGGLCRNLPFQLELNVSNRGMPSLFNGQPDLEQLRIFVDKLTWDRLASLFMLKAELKDTITPHLDALGLPPAWPKKATGLISPYALVETLPVAAEQTLRRAGLLALLLNLKLPTGNKTGIPTSEQRELILLQGIATEGPEWISAVTDQASRRVLTALWSAALADQDSDLEQTVWGEDGLLRGWLEGGDEQYGFNRHITGHGTQVIAGVERHFRQLLSRRRVVVADEGAEGRCLFTDQPVLFSDSIDASLGLYGVRVSAFSGRDGRPESLVSERSHTNVSPVSVAEHKLRNEAHAGQGGKVDGVPNLISSPTTPGLFGGLCLNTDDNLRALSVFDASRLEVKKGAVVKGSEAYRGRYRVARFERLGEKTADQIDRLRLLLTTCRRLGRPIHVFRGLPTPRREFFYFDAMPRMLADLIGDDDPMHLDDNNGLRLEQLPSALERLELAQTLLQANGLGYDLVRLYAASKTRFRALCLAWCHLHDDLAHAKPAAQAAIKTTLGQLDRQYYTLEEKALMNDQDGPLVRLGRAAAGIQRTVGPQASANEETLVFSLCMDAANAARAAGQTDATSLVNGIAAELETNLVRKSKAAARRHRDDVSLRDGCIQVAELFVHEVWNGVLKNHSPSQRTRRILGSIYRMSFLRAAKHTAKAAASNH